MASPKLPITPIEAASVGEATPKIIEPNTRIITKIKGNTLIVNIFKISTILYLISSEGKEGASSGFNLHITII